MLGSYRTMNREKIVLHAHAATENDRMRMLCLHEEKNAQIWDVKRHTLRAVISAFLFC